MSNKSLRNICNHLAFVFQVELKNLQEALVDDYQVMMMHEELNQFKRNNVWTLVPKLDNHTIIGTIQVVRNKLDENGIIIRNKVRLVAKDYNQEEGVEYDEPLLLLLDQKPYECYWYLLVQEILNFFKWM